MRFSLVVPLAPERQIKILDSINKADFDKNQVEVIVEVGKNPSVNRNNAARKARGEIIGFLDDDAMVRQDILKNVDAFFTSHQNHSIVGGPQLTTSNESFFGRYSGYALSSFFGTMGMSARYKKAKLNLDANEVHLTSANMFVKREVLEKIGGFNPDLFPGEDPEFLARAKLAGFKIAYSPEVVVFHKRRSTPGAFFRQLFTYGKTRLKKESMMKTSPGLIFFTPALFVVYLAFLLPLALMSRFFLIPLSIYLGVAFVFSGWISIKNKDPLAVLLVPAMFLLLHVAYGCGMIAFVVRKLSA